MWASNYKLIEEAEPEEFFLMKHEDNAPHRLISLEKDMEEMNREEDFMAGSEDAYYDEDLDAWVMT
jgi:hypothetical protein